MGSASTLSPSSVGAFAKLAELIREARVGMFTTATVDGLLHSRPLVTREADAAGNAL